MKPWRVLTAAISHALHIGMLKHTSVRSCVDEASVSLLHCRAKQQPSERRRRPQGPALLQEQQQVQGRLHHLPHLPQVLSWCLHGPSHSNGASQQKLLQEQRPPAA